MLVLLVVCAAIALVVDLMKVDSTISMAAQSNARSQVLISEAEIYRRCLKVASNDVAECISKIDQSVFDNQGVVAAAAVEQSNAWWTKISAVCTLIGAVISAIGVPFFIYNLQQVRIGLERTHSSEAALFIIGSSLKRNRTKEYRVAIENQGKTTGFILGFHIEALENLPASFQDWRASERCSKEYVLPLRPGEICEKAAWIDAVSPLANHIMGRISYIDVFKVWHITGFRYDKSGNRWIVNREGDWCFTRIGSTENINLHL